MHVITDTTNHEISYNYGLYCMSLCGHMDPCEVISTKDSKRDIDLACEFDITFAS